MAVQPPTLVEIATNVIHVPARRLRLVVEQAVAELASSIELLGLLEPILVAPDLTLIAGLHRLRAHERLGRATISARVLDLDQVRQEMVEIDENLVRAPLTELEAAEHLQRRKELYEALHPETRHGVAGGLAGGRGRAKQTKDPSAAIPSLVSSFAHELGRTLGVSERHVQQSVQIGLIESHVRQLIRTTPLATNRQALLVVARATRGQQEAVALRLLDGAKATAAFPVAKGDEHPSLIMAAHVGTSADIFPEILSLHVPFGATIADVTFGQGVFWTKIPHGRYRLLPSDLQTGVDFRKLPYPDAHVDALVLDPPYMHTPGGTAHQGHQNYEGAYQNNAASAPEGTKYHEAVLALYLQGAAEAYRVLRPRGLLIVKVQDEVCAGTLRFTHAELIERLAPMGLKAVDIFLLVARTKPGVSRMNKQRTARRNYSYFLVFKRRR